MEEIIQLHTHDVYEKVLEEQCWQSTGGRLVKVKWADITKRDEVNHEYRSRLVAKERQMNKRLNLSAATPSLATNKAIFSGAAAEGTGYAQ